MAYLLRIWDASLAGYPAIHSQETFLIIISVSLGHSLKSLFRNLLLADPLCHYIQFSRPEMVQRPLPKDSITSVSCVFSTSCSTCWSLLWSLPTLLFSSMTPSSLYFSLLSTQLIGDPASHTSQIPQGEHSWPQSHFAIPSSFLFLFIFPQGND